MRKLKSSTGPKKGSLLIAGGGSIGFFKEFMELAGGPKAKIVVIPTALAPGELSNEFLANFKKRFLNEGFKNVKVLHTRSRKEANSKKFVKPILEADGVLFSGGRQWRHADSYLNTLAHKAFKDVLDRGGVISGGSAGASIQGSYLARGDSQGNTSIMGDHEEGLGFLKNTAIDQHLLARNRQFDMFELLEKKPELLGLGIDENTAIVVQGNKFRVIGQSYVIVYDDTRWSIENNEYEKLPKGSKEFYFLRAGQEYNLKKQKVVQFKDRSFLDYSKKKLSKYVGKYFNKESNMYYEFSLQKKTIFLQKLSFPNKHILLQESDKRFFMKDSDFSLEFDFSKKGKIKGFTFLPRNTYWKREV